MADKSTSKQHVAEENAPDVYKLIHAFLVSKEHSKAAKAVQKLTEVGDDMPEVGLEDILKEWYLLKKQVVAKEGDKSESESDDDSDSSSSSSSSSDSESGAPSDAASSSIPASSKTVKSSTPESLPSPVKEHVSLAVFELEKSAKSNGEKEEESSADSTDDSSSSSSEDSDDESSDSSSSEDDDSDDDSEATEKPVDAIVVDQVVKIRPCVVVAHDEGIHLFVAQASPAASSSSSSSSSESSTESSSEDELETPAIKANPLKSNEKSGVRGGSVASSSDDESSSDSSSSSDDDDEPAVPTIKTGSPESALKRKRAESSKVSSSSDSESSSASSSSEDEEEAETPAATAKPSSPVMQPGLKRKRSASTTSVSSSSAASSSSASTSSSSSSDSDSDSDSDSSKSPGAESTPQLASPPKEQITIARTTITESKTVKKRKIDETGQSIATSTFSTERQVGDEVPKSKGRRGGVPFQRIKSSDVTYHHEGLKDNSFVARGAGQTDYGAQASKDLIVTRGAGFRKEKNKKKRGSYRGGEITMQSHSIKFS